MLKPELIVVHHSLTADSGTLSWDNIIDYHVNHNGWSDVGYHAGCELIDDKYICTYGRPTWKPGAHTKGHNRRSLGFCFVGNFDLESPSTRQLRVGARRVLAPWLLWLGLGVDAVVPHRQFAVKSCPGRKFNMDILRTIIKEEMYRADSLGG